LVDSSDFTDETKSVSKLGVVGNNDVSDEVKLVFNIATDAVDASFVCSGEDSVCCDATSELDTTSVEVGRNDVSTKDSVVVVVLRISIGV
jgi:hypothetical protein